MLDTLLYILTKTEFILYGGDFKGNFLSKLLGKLRRTSLIQQQFKQLGN